MIDNYKLTLFFLEKSDEVRSALQMHRKAIIVADDEACQELKVSTYRYFKDIERNNL